MNIERPMVVDHLDLERFVEEKLGVKPDIQQGEYSNGSYIEVEAIALTKEDFEVDDASSWQEEYEQQTVDFLANELPDIYPEYLMSFLATKKYIEPGNYLIRIWW